MSLRDPNVDLRLVAKTYGASKRLHLGQKQGLKAERAAEQATTGGDTTTMSEKRGQAQPGRAKVKVRAGRQERGVSTTGGTERAVAMVRLLSGPGSFKNIFGRLRLQRL
jgi:hypothetical protein